MIYYNVNEILIRDIQSSDVSMIAAEEMAQGWGANEEKYKMRLQHQKEGKCISIIAEFKGNIAGCKCVSKFRTRRFCK